jgi:chitin disaccharide deacetylase
MTGRAARSLIVNADDFGLSAGVNAGIAAAHERGVVTSASLMVRRAAAASAAGYAAKHPDLAVGLHVDLGEWTFRDGQWVAIQEITGPVEAEISAQMVEFRRLVGHDPTHLDSHQHVHHQEPVLSLLRSLAASLAVPLRAHSPISYVGDFYGQTGNGSPLHDAITFDALVHILRKLNPGITELACHPGCDEKGVSTYGIERAIETATLCDPRLRVVLDELDIRLASFATFASR